MQSSRTIPAKPLTAVRVPSLGAPLPPPHGDVRGESLRPSSTHTLTPTQVAHRIGLSPGTIRRYIIEGHIPQSFVRRPGLRKILLSPDAVLHILTLRPE